MIGVFDSGVGGLTVVRALMKKFPGYEIVYFGDTARTPYGTKSADTVIGYALENTDFLLNEGAQMIVVACNTVSSVAMQKMTGLYPVPIFDVISPAVAVTTASPALRIGIIGTRTTIESGVYEHKILEAAPQTKVYSAACPLLVPLVEEGWLKKPETNMIVKKYLHPLKVRQIDTLILGCTHYPMLKKTIQEKIGRRVRIIDSAETVCDSIETYLEQHPETDARLSRNDRIRLFVSDLTAQFEAAAKMILKRNVELRKAKFPA